MTLTTFNSRHGGFLMFTTAGKSTTPTLVILSEREREIRNFSPQDYWEIHTNFETENGSYSGKWFRETFEKDATNDQLKAERIWTEKEANEIHDRCIGKTGIIEENQKPAKQAPPQLFDLTTLQREASSKFGFSARNTLAICSISIRKTQITDLPKNRFKCLPEDYIDTIKSNINDFSNSIFDADNCINESLLAHPKLLNNWIKPNKKGIMTPRSVITLPLFRQMKYPLQISRNKSKRYMT